MKLREILDSIKDANDIATNAELGRILDIDLRRIGDYYTGKREPTSEDYPKIANGAGISAGELWETVQVERAKDKKTQKAWENYMKRLGGVAASFLITLCVTVTMAVTSTPVEARPFYVSSPSDFVLCKQFWKLKIKAILRRIGQKCTFRVNIARICQMTT